MHAPRPSVLALRVLFWVLLTSFAVFALATAYGYSRERDEALEAAHLDAQDTAEQSLSAISALLWQYDVNGLNAVLTGMVASRVVVRAEVLDPEKVVAAVSAPDFQGPVDRVWAIPIGSPDHGTPIGQLRISESYAHTQEQLGGTLVTLVMTDLLKIVGCALVLFAIVYRTVAKPLHQLALHVKRLGHAVEAPGLTVVHDKASSQRDEIDILADSFNRFATERKQAEEALRIAATAFESQQGTFITDATHRILRVNRAFTVITGYSGDEAVGRSPMEFASDRQDNAFHHTMMQRLTQTGAWSGQVWNRRKNGEVYPAWLSLSAVTDDAGVATHHVAIFSDTSDRVRAQETIDTLAFYDPLTRLPNRRLLLDRLTQALHTSTRHARKNALLFVDLDNFRTLNDTLGHQQGDLLLVQVAHRLNQCVQEGDTLARLGSDEFVVMLENLSEDAIEAATQAEDVGDAILGAFVSPFMLEQHAHHCTPSIGVALFGGGNVEAGAGVSTGVSDQPLKQAELAMFQAKSAGRNTLRFFEEAMQAEVSARAALEADLREAVQQQQFELLYQPQVVGSSRITGVEALLRWRHPLRGMVSPAEFIPLAEETGLILPIGQWVLDSACACLAAWAQDPALAQLTVAVNVSARQFRQADFADHVLATLERHHAPPGQLKLELTESMLVQSVEDTIAVMGLLKNRGVGFSLDDFGTGYSSLSYLKRLPLDQLKIDQGFVRNIVTDPNDAAIAKMVVVLAESLGLCVIAEGVELQAQADFLARQGCHAYQGYLFSRPLPQAALEALVRQAAEKIVATGAV